MTALIEDFVRRVGLAVGAARAYTRQATISRILQRGLLPSKVADIPGVTSSLVYEPSDDGVVGGDFYDIFACPGDRWCFILGDVQGSGPEAAVVTGLARPWLRLLAGRASASAKCWTGSTASSSTTRWRPPKPPLSWSLRRAGST